MKKIRGPGKGNNEKYRKDIWRREKLHRVMSKDSQKYAASKPPQKGYRSIFFQDYFNQLSHQDLKNIIEIINIFIRDYGDKFEVQDVILWILSEDGVSIRIKLKLEHYLHQCVKESFLEYLRTCNKPTEKAILSFLSKDDNKNSWVTHNSWVTDNREKIIEALYGLETLGDLNDSKTVNNNKEETEYGSESEFN